MKEVLVISGKGGTGKTSIVGSFAALADHKVLVDCDVDAADLYLLLQPKIKENHSFYGLDKAVINSELCVHCGRCREVCRFNAITEDYSVDHFFCEGCTVCSYFCPQQAIEMKPNKSGEWFESDTAFGPLVHAKLGVAEENSGKLVSKIRQAARSIAENGSYDFILTDGPPGIGCPVISSISGVDLALIVAEPSISGLHDLERTVQLCVHFNVPTMVCVNKWDLAPGKTREIINYTTSTGLEFVGTIPFDEAVKEANIKNLPVVEVSNLGAATAIRGIWQKVEENLF